jgi:hypothetical protein
MIVRVKEREREIKIERASIILLDKLIEFHLRHFAPPMNFEKGKEVN